MNLTNEQQKAVDAFFSFLLSEDKNFYLFGSAGTGKSFLIKYFLDSVLEQYRQTNQLYSLNDPLDHVVVSAPTHKAVEALHDKTNKEVITTFEAIQVRVKTSGRKVEYIPYGPMPSTDILFIDECSFLPEDLLPFINACAKKVVYIGDPYQLIPEKGINWLKYTSKASILTEVKRTGNQDIMDMSNYLRNLLISGSKNKIDVTLDSDCIHILNDDQMIKNLDDTFKTSDTNGKVLCFTNECVLNYLKYIQSTVRKEFRDRVPKNTYINNAFTEISQNRKFYPETPIKLIKFIEDRNFRGIDYEVWNCEVYGRIHTLPVVKNANELKLALRKYWDNTDVYDTLKKGFVDLRQPWASTIHKSQGSSYDTVFIDLNSFKVCKDLETAIRLLYVAVSRAVDKVYLYGSLPKRFGSIKDANALSI